jgi:hypothetical protein
MHAVVLTPDAQIALEDRPEPQARGGEVLIGVGAAGICGTDLHAPAMPAIFAHSVVFASLRDPERAVKIFLDPAAASAPQDGHAQWPARAGMTSSA